MVSSSRFDRFLKACRWWLSPREWLRSIVSLDDSVHNIALGTAIGVFIALTPTVGIQMILVMLVALFLRFNRMAALIAVYITNPITTIPIYYFNYKVGTLIFEETWTYEDFSRILSGRWRQALEELVFEVGLPLLVGSLIVATVCSVVTYPGMCWLLQTLRGRAARDESAEAVLSTRESAGP